MMQPMTAGVGEFVGQQLQAANASGWLAAATCALGVLVLACTGVWLAATDIRYHRLPRKVVWPLYPAVTAPLGVSASLGGEPVRWWWMLWGLMIMGGLFVLLRLVYPAGMGLGDVRLAGVLGIATGFASVSHTFMAIAVTFVLAGLFSAALLAARKIEMSSRVAFGPFMLVGSLGVLAFI